MKYPADLILTPPERIPRRLSKQRAWFYIDRRTVSFYKELDRLGGGTTVTAISVSTNRLRRALAEVDRQVAAQKRKADGSVQRIGSDDKGRP